MAKTSFYSSSGATSTETDAIESSVNSAAASATAAAASATSAAASAAILDDETVQDKVGAMFSSNTETGITITYQDSDGTIDAVVDTSSLTETLTNKTLTSPVLNTGVSGTAIKDEDNMSSNSATHLATQQSIKAYVDDVAQTTEEVQDIVGAMFSSNTETGIAATYEDSDGTIDLVVGNAPTATALQNARTIGGTSFDGTANIAVALAATATTLASARTIHGVSFDGSSNIDLSEEICDTVGNMVTSNTESGITVAYDDSDNTLDFTVGTLNQNTTGTADNITVSANNSTDETVYPLFVDGATGSQGAESDTGLTYNPSSGLLTSTLFAGALTGNVTGNVSGSSGSTTGNAATATALQNARTIGGTSFDGTSNINVALSTLASTVTVSDSSANTNFPVVFHDESNALLDDTGALRYNPSTGTLLVPNLSVSGTTTQVNTVTMEASNAIIFEGATADSNETTLSIVDPTSDHTQYLVNQGGYIPVLAAATTTAITSTPAELNILDGVTSTAAELNILDGVTSTAAELNILDGVTSTAAELNLVDGSSANTVVNSKAVIYGSSGELAGTLSTAAQPNITSVGTLTALTGGTGDFNWDSNTLVVDSSTNRVGIGNAAPDVSLDLGSNTDAVHMPSGTTAQRPASPAAGYFRYNSETSQMELYTDEWGAVAGSGGSGTNMDTDIFAGDGSDTTFTLSTACSDEQNLMVFIDGVFQAHDSYSVSGGTTLTFSTAPANNRVITAYHSTTTVGGSNNTINTMTGDNSDTTLTLSVAPVHENNVQVFLDGVYQAKSNYSISGTTLTFSTAPPTGVLVEAITNTNTSSTTANQLIDADSDTLIQVEESSDEDVIRMDIEGSEVAVLNSTSLTLKNPATADNSTFNLNLQTAEADIAADDVLAKISFSSPNEGTGTDALLTAAAIQAVSEGDFSSSSNATSLQFMTGASEAATEKMRISSIGQLKISTDYNNEVAHRIQNVNTGNAAESNLYLTNADNNAAGLALGVVGTGASGAGGYVQDGCYVVAGTLASGGLSLMTRSNSDIRFCTNGHTNERMRITGGGGLLVGTTTSLGSGLVTIYSSNNSGLAIGYGTGTNEYRRLYHHSTGLYFESSTNQAYLNASGAWVDASDITYKKDIQDIDYGIETVKKLKPRKYKMKSDDTEQIGFVAQELIEQLPEIVDGKDGILGVSYGHITAVLTKAIQEQQVIIDSALARIKTLEDA